MKIFSAAIIYMARGSNIITSALKKILKTS